MKNLFLLSMLIVTLGVASAQDERCAWGESYWCSSIKTAKDCGAFGHCINTIWKNQELEKDDTDICTYCKNVIQDVKTYIGNKQTQDEIKQYLESACSIIPVQQMADECKTTVDNYLPEVFDLITAELDPQVVCSLIGLCKGLEDQVPHHETIHRVSLLKIPTAKIEPICTDCKKFMQDVKDMLTSGAMEKQIEEYLDQYLCSALGSYKSECTALVDAYAPEIVELLAGEFDPAMICQSMGFCNQTLSTPKALLAKMKLRESSLYKTAKMVGDTAECDVCKTVVGELQALGKDKTTQEEVEAFLKNEICSKLGALKGACDESVDTYGPELFQLLAEELDPDTLCKSLGLCSGTVISNSIFHQDEVLKFVPKPVKTSAQCILCEFIMTQLDKVLKDNATEADIQKALDQVCSYLPTTIASECKAFVDEYAPAIIAILSQEMDPSLVCSTLGLCSGAKAYSKLPASPEVCGVCETMVQYLDSLLTEKATEQEIKALLDKICNFLPADMKTECDGIVEQYADEIIQLITQFADPKEVCTELGLCSAMMSKVMRMRKIVPGKAALLGTDKCTYGPSFWCANQENAELCKAVSHCKKHHWKN